MDVPGQISGLHRTTLVQIRQSRTFPRDATASVRGQGESLGRLHIVVVIPDSVVVSLAVGQESGQGAGKGVALSTGALETAWDL